MKLLLVVLYLLLSSATAALFRAVALVVARALGTLGGLCRRRCLSHLGDVERLPRADLVGGDVIALFELLDTHPVLLSDGVERLPGATTWAVVVVCCLGCSAFLLRVLRRTGCSSSVAVASSSLEDRFLVTERVGAELLGPSRLTRSSGECTSLPALSSLRMAERGGVRDRACRSLG